METPDFQDKMVPLDRLDPLVLSVPQDKLALLEQLDLEARLVSLDHLERLEQEVHRDRMVNREQRGFKVRPALRVRVVHVELQGPPDSQDRLVKGVLMDPREALEALEPQVSPVMLDHLVSWDSLEALVLLDQLGLRDLPETRVQQDREELQELQGHVGLMVSEDKMVLLVALVQVVRQAILVRLVLEVLRVHRDLKADLVQLVLLGKRELLAQKVLLVQSVLMDQLEVLVAEVLLEPLEVRVKREDLAMLVKQVIKATPALLELPDLQDQRVSKDNLEPSVSLDCPDNKGPLELLDLLEHPVTKDRLERLAR